MLVSTVTAMTQRRLPPFGVPRSRAPPRAAACIICAPPDAWTLTIHTPSEVAAATALATVFGMSWNLRSRKTRSPLAASVRTMTGPSAVNSWLPILKPPTMPRSVSASCSASPPVGTSSAIRS